MNHSTNETDFTRRSVMNKKFKSGAVATIAAGHTIHDTYTAFLAPLLPVFIARFSLSKTEAGLLTVFMQAPSLLQFVIGHFADRTSLKYFIIMAPGVAGIAMCLLGIAPGYAAIAFLLIIAGLNSAGFHATAPVLAGTLSGNNLGKGMGFWMLGGELGRTIGPIVLVSTITLVSLPGLLYLIPVGVLTSFILYLRLHTAEETHRRERKSGEWRSTLRHMRPFFLPLAAVIFLRSFAIVSMTTFLPTYLSEKGSSLWLAGAALSVLEAAGMGGALAGGWKSDHFGRRFVLVISFIATPLLLLIFLITQGWLQFPLLILLGFFGLSITPVIMALVQESFPENRAFANGIYMTISFILRSVAVVLVGAMGDYFSLQTAFTISAGLMLVGLIFIFMLPVQPNSNG